LARRPSQSGADPAINTHTYPPDLDPNPKMIGFQSLGSKISQAIEIVDANPSRFRPYRDAG